MVGVGPQWHQDGSTEQQVFSLWDCESAGWALCRNRDDLQNGRGFLSNLPFSTPIPNTTFSAFQLEFPLGGDVISGSYRPFSPIFAGYHLKRSKIRAHVSPVLFDVPRGHLLFHAKTRSAATLFADARKAFELLPPQTQATQSRIFLTTRSGRLGNDVEPG